MTWSLLFFTTNIFLGIGLAMDAFSVSMANGLNEPHMNKGRVCTIAGVFGGFQALMPLIGWLLGSRFKSYITAIDHWIAFVLLLIIGANMIKESFDKSEESANASLGFKIMLMLAIATSIDALAVGVTFAFLDVNIWWAVIFIGSITFTLSAIGVKAGSVFGVKYKSKAELAGGIILILIGTKSTLELYRSNGIKIWSKYSV